MAKQRVQVRELNLPTGVSPTASPVSTYVRPEQIQSQPSELSQFLTAITPAIKVNADEKRVARLRDEQEIRNNTRQNQLAQANLQVINANALMDADYKANASTLLEQNVPESEVRAYYGEFASNYVNSLGDVSPIIKDTIARDLATSIETAIVTKYRPAILARTEEDIQAQFSQGLNSLNTQLAPFDAEGKPNQLSLEAVGKLVDSHIEANPVAGGDLAATRRKVNDDLATWAAEESGVRPFSPVVLYAQSKILGSGRHQDQRLIVEKNQATASKGNKTAEKARLVEGWHQDAAISYFESGNLQPLVEDRDVDIGGGFTTKPDNTITATNIDAIYALKVAKAFQTIEEIGQDSTKSLEQKQQEVQSIQASVIEPLNQKYYGFYNTTGEVPTEVAVSALSLNENTSQNMADPIVSDKLEQAYTQLDKFNKYDGSLKDKLNDKAYTIFTSAQALVDNGLMDVKGAFAFLQSTELDITKKDTSITTESIADQIDGSDWFGLFTPTNKEEAINLDIMTPEVQKLVPILKQVLGTKSDEEILELAVKKVSENYATVKLPSGKFSLINAPRNSKKGRAAVEDIETGLVQIMQNQELSNYIHAALGVAPRYVMSDGSIMDSNALVQAREQGILPVNIATDMANFELEVRTNENNPNIAYIFATTKDDTGSVTNSILLPNGFIDLQNFSVKQMGILKDTYVSSFEDQVANGAINLDDMGMSQYEDLGADTVGQVGIEEQIEDELTQALDTLSTEVSPLEVQTRLFGAGDARKADRSLRKFMENSRNELLERARASVTDKGGNPDTVDEASESIFDSLLDMLGLSDKEAEASELVPSEVAVPSSEISERTFIDSTIDTTPLQGDTVEDKAANLIQVQEDFKANPYPDGKNKSVGYGFYLPSLEADEKALIKDVNNITEPEAQAVMKLKVSKITKFMQNEIDNFDSLPESTQLGITSMAFQLGRQNVRDEWPKFMTAIKKASGLPTGSTKQLKALEEASKHMLFNVKNGKKIKTTWHNQTPNRANEMARFIKGK